MNCLALEVQSIAGCSLRETFDSMKDLSRRLSCHVTSNVNDAQMMVFEDSEYDDFVEQYLIQLGHLHG